MTAWLDAIRLLPKGAAWLRLGALILVGAALVYVVYSSRDSQMAQEWVMPDMEDTITPVEKIENAAEGYRPRKVLARPLRPITDAPVVSADEANKNLNGEELVLGVVVGDEARAYPVNMLTGPRREIINDQLGGRAIAATW